MSIEKHQMEESYKKLLEGNRRFALSKQFEDPQYFKKLSLGQKPEYLWIGCSDSRVTAEEMMGLGPGEAFVHRNIANLVNNVDLNVMSVINYAIKNLGVKHIIVCGHYGCGGVLAAMGNNMHGYVDNWLRNIKDVYLKHQAELDAIADPDQKTDRLTELNVIEQVRNLAKTGIVQQAWKTRELHLHGWVYGINSGLVTDLSVIHDSNEDIDPIYRFNLK